MTYSFNLMNNWKNINGIIFIVLKKAQVVVQKTSRKNVTQLFWFGFFSVFLMDVMGGKMAINLKEVH